MERQKRPEHCYFPKEKVIELCESGINDVGCIIHECPLWSIACYDCEAQRERMEIQKQEF